MLAGVFDDSKLVKFICSGRQSFLDRCESELTIFNHLLMLRQYLLLECNRQIVERFHLRIGNFDLVLRIILDLFTRQLQAADLFDFLDSLLNVACRFLHYLSSLLRRSAETDQSCQLLPLFLLPSGGLCFPLSLLLGGLFGFTPKHFDLFQVNFTWQP